MDPADRIGRDPPRSGGRSGWARARDLPWNSDSAAASPAHAPRDDCSQHAARPVGLNMGPLAFRVAMAPTPQDHRQMPDLRARRGERNGPRRCNIEGRQGARGYFVPILRGNRRRLDTDDHGKQAHPDAAGNRRSSPANRPPGRNERDRPARSRSWRASTARPAICAKTIERRHALWALASVASADRSSSKSPGMTTSTSPAIRCRTGAILEGGKHRVVALSEGELNHVRAAERRTMHVGCHGPSRLDCGPRNDDTARG